MSYVSLTVSFRELKNFKSTLAVSCKTTISISDNIKLKTELVLLVTLVGNHGNSETGELDSSDRILISLNGKTKIIAFFFGKRKIEKN